MKRTFRHLGGRYVSGCSAIDVAAAGLAQSPVLSATDANLDPVQLIDDANGRIQVISQTAHHRPLHLLRAGNARLPTPG